MDDYTLPFDPQTKDIVCRRNDDGTKSFNISRYHTHHSPTGFDWGYGGSGPADFALNILTLFIDPSKLTHFDDYPIELWDKTQVSRAVWDYHHDVKWHFIAGLPYEGGTIPGDAIRGLLRDLKDWPEGAIL